MSGTVSVLEDPPRSDPFARQMPDNSPTRRNDHRADTATAYGDAPAREIA